MLTGTGDSENVSGGSKKKKMCVETIGDSSSVEIESEHLFPDAESKNASTEAINGNPPEDTVDLDIPESLTLARVDRENQGPWEAEYSYGGEADLHLHYDNCPKNPGHKNFIPVDKFSIDDLPEGYRDPVFMEYIRAESDLTVRVIVKYVSDKRPDSLPGSDKPYPGCGNRGQRRMTLGTGWVNMSSVTQEGTCKCKDCRSSPTPETTYATISITTATHVVFDACEGEHTTCHLFFDSGGTPNTCSGVITLTGMSSKFSNFATDWCHMTHFTHDVDLAYRLEQRVRLRSELINAISTKLPRIINYKRSPNAEEKWPLLVIVSHPHGCRKHISIGRWTSVNSANSLISSYEYTTATCPGSSGAHVYMPHMLSTIIKLTGWRNDPGIHSGASVVRPGINYCYIEDGHPFKPCDFMFPEKLPLYAGPGEDNFSCVDEQDLNKHYHSCQKNPGHQNFFPLDKFSMDNLPPFYRTDRILKAIKSVSDLTVQVSVNYVSEERPKTAPGTDISYSWYSTRGGNQMRVGSGWVTDVLMSDNVMFQASMCKECMHYLPSKVDLAYIYVSSAARLIYDRIEAENTTCHLFFDSGETADFCNDVIKLTNMAHYCNYPLKDTCNLVYVTDDLKFARRLKTMKKRYKRCFHSLTAFFRAMYKEMHTNWEKACPKTPLYIVVSHPHGCAKQISVSYSGNDDNPDTDNNQSSFTSVTCVGCTGAPVIAMGSDTYFPCHALKPCPYMFPEKLPLYAGPGEDNFSCVDEQDLNKHYLSCQKNPGHQNFFPLDKFSMDNLPPFYRKDRILKAIKSVSDLTVQVSVNYVSEERPKTAPGTDISYSWYSTRGGNQTRVGSGWVTDVEIHKNASFPASDCKECMRDLPSTGDLAYIYISSAARLIYDRMEAEHTTCHLFFDSGETPDLCKDVVSLTNTAHYCKSVLTDKCNLVYVTHDLTFAHRLKKMKKRYKRCFHSLSEFFRAMYKEMHTERETASPNIPVYIVVSHPHGCAKQISVSYSGNDDNPDTDNNQSSFTSVTCVGCTGAPVLALGPETYYPCE